MGADDAERATLAARNFLAVVFTSSALWLCWLTGADVSLGDSGEIGTASYVLGVAHPTGFPLDLLVLRLSSFLPLGSIVWRQNVAVAMTSAFFLMLLAQLSLLLQTRLGLARGKRGWAPALLAVFAVLTFQTFLGTALGVEVYSTALVLLALAAQAALLDVRLSRLCWPIFGLALGAHVSAGYLMLPLLCATVFARPATARLRFALTHAMCALGTALVIAYLPLASLRDSVADWGDPQSPAALLAHLTGARIRSSFARQMFAAPTAPAAMLGSQLAEHTWLIAVALFGAGWLLVRARRVGLLILSVLALDLAYAMWINPMGIAQRQLGHAAFAVVALLAALGTSVALARFDHSRAGRSVGLVAILGLVVLLCLDNPWPTQADGYLAAERYGSGSPLVSLPPRSVVLCTSDSACACGLFALYVEDARPDMAIAPTQHLWDPTVLRRIPELTHSAASHPSRPPDAAGRSSLATGTLRSLVAGPSTRPIFFESADPLEAAAPKTFLEPAPVAPFLQVAPDVPGSATPSLASLDGAVHARFGASGAMSKPARQEWARAYDEVGKAALRRGQLLVAVTALRRELAIDAERSVGWSNLGVALELVGDFPAAASALRRAIDLAPERPTAWLNLARLELRTGGPSAASAVLRAAVARGVHDQRFDRVQREMERSGQGAAK